MSKKPLTVYTVIPPQHTASFYYRLQVPLETASVLGLNVRSIIDVNDSAVSAEERINNFCSADIVNLYQPIGDGPINNIRGLQGFIPTKVDGEWKWPPTVIMETDDNLFNVSPFNNAFKSLGIRDMNGNQIPIGHHIGVVQNGERKILWADGENDFSIAKNRQRLASYKSILEMVDVVQCSTPEVEKSVLREAKPRRTKVFPNLVRFDHYPQFDIVKDPKRIRILWQGGQAHYEDWFPLKEAIGNVCKKYPEVDWVIWGFNFGWVNEVIPAHRLEYMDWCKYQEYKLRLCTIGHDIALAPLADNVFNCCRSAIKWYEASVFKTPAATLAQSTGAYKAEIQDGKTGLLFSDPKEFEEKLCLLIEDTKLRKELGANAKQWISENRDAMKVVPQIVSFWETLREERKLEQPHMTDKAWEAYESSVKAEAETGATDEPVPALNESS